MMAIPVHAWAALQGIFTLLIAASLIVYALRNRPMKNYAELALRVKTWWLMAGLFGLSLVLYRTISIVFFAFVSFLAFKEFLSLIPIRRADRRVLFWAYLAIPFQYLWVAKAWYGMFIIFIPVYLFLFLPLRMVLIGETKGFLNASGTVHWGLMTTVFSLSHASFLLALPAERNPLAGGAGLVIFLVFLTQLNDIAQFVFGKCFGHRQVIPRVSPNKTVEGLLGGVFTTVLVAYALGEYLTPMTSMQSLLSGLLIGFGGFIGDVTISCLKRDLGIKDSGSLLPGHGGILDRVDSLTYTAPLFFHYIYYLCY